MVAYPQVRRSKLRVPGDHRPRGSVKVYAAATYLRDVAHFRRFRSRIESDDKLDSTEKASILADFDALEARLTSLLAPYTR